MTLFLNAHADRIAPGSFQQPVPLPESLPGSPDFVTVCFNKDWLPYVLGCLFQLTLNTTWSVSSQSELDNALGQANNLILIFQQALAGCQTQNPAYSGTGEDDFMLRQNPDNPCLLETSVNGVDWCVWADLSKCTGQPLQPGKGSTNPPSGDCAKFFGTVEMGGRWMLPNNVSSGDVITVTNAVGTWASLLDLYVPRCPDGNIFFEVGCISGTGHTEMGDPAPAINHDSLIAFDGTNYYDLGAASDGSPVVITIPGGIVKQNLYFFCNTSDTANFSGAVNFDVEYCNNAVGSFTHVFDFTSGNGGWLPLALTAPCGTGVSAVYVPGTGWQSGNVICTAGVDGYRATDIKRTFSARVITQIQVVFTKTFGVTYASGDDDFIRSSLSGTPTTLLAVPYNPGPTSPWIWTGSQNMDEIELDNICGVQVPAGDPGGQCTISKVIVMGTGSDPF